MLRQKWVRGNREEAWIEKRVQTRIQEDAALTEAQESSVPLGSSCEALTWIYFLEWRCVPNASGENTLQVRKPEARCCAFPSLRDQRGKKTRQEASSDTKLGSTRNMLCDLGQSSLLLCAVIYSQAHSNYHVFLAKLDRSGSTA